MWEKLVVLNDIGKKLFFGTICRKILWLFHPFFFFVYHSYPLLGKKFLFIVCIWEFFSRLYKNFHFREN